MKRRAAVAAFLLGGFAIAATVAAAHTRHHHPGCRTVRCDRHIDVVWGHLHHWHQPPREVSGYAGGGSYQGASWYNEYEGGTACGFHAALGVANKYLPCGTQVVLCSDGGCATATVDDRGPFVPGREWDLSEALRDAIGYPGDPAGVTVR